MADANSVSDTQVLLQSMLQRLKLQPKPESNNTHTHDNEQYNTTLIEKNGSAVESPPQTPPMYDFNFSMDKSLVTNLPEPPSPGLTGVTTPHSQEFAKGIDAHIPIISSTPKQETPSWRFTSKQTIFGQNSDVSMRVDDGVTLKQAKKHKLLQTKMSYSSVSSLQSVERLFPSWSQMDSNIHDQGVRQKKWTQKVKEKWKERYKSTPTREQHDKESKEQSNMTNSIRSPIPLQTMFNETNTTTGFNEEVRVQLQPINDGPVEDIPSSFDQMSETLFSQGSFNLMEEIFTGQEWAKFLPSSTNSHSSSNFITQDQRVTSSISRSHQNEPSQWNYTAATGPNLGMIQSQMKPGCFFTMDTSENMLNQTKTSSYGMSEVHNGQCGVSDSGSNHLESMDQSASPLGNNHPINEERHIYPYNHTNTTELNITPLLSSKESGNVFKATEIYHNQSERVHEVLPELDLTYLQSKDSASLKKQVPLNRKRSHTTERSVSNERWRSAPEEMYEWRQNFSHSDPAPSLSPASSTSSVQHSLSQESESSLSTETVIKKRRVEDIRRVRFSEVVTIVPPLVLYDEGDADDEDYGHNSNEGNDEPGEESVSPPSVPRWIEALRSKTKRKPKIKLPRMRSKKYRFV